MKEDDEVDNLYIKLDVKRKSKRIYQSSAPEVNLKISRSLKVNLKIQACLSILCVSQPTFTKWQGKKECFASCLFVCYDLIQADVALELAWMNNMTDFAFSCLLQFIRDYTGKVDELIKDKIDALNEVKSKEKMRRRTLSNNK